MVDSSVQEKQHTIQLMEIKCARRDTTMATIFSPFYVGLHNSYCHMTVSNYE